MQGTKTKTIDELVKGYAPTELKRVDGLTKDEHASLISASLLSPPIPDGHLFLYAAEVAAYEERYLNACTSKACSLLRTCLGYLDALAAGWAKLRNDLKTQHKVTKLFFTFVVALEIVVFFSLFAKKGVVVHETNETLEKALRESAKLVETAGDIALALGGLWTASGVILSVKEIQELFAGGSAGDAKKVMAVLSGAAQTASKRAWQGVGMLLFGTAALLVKAWWLG